MLEYLSNEYNSRLAYRSLPKSTKYLINMVNTVGMKEKKN